MSGLVQLGAGEQLREPAAEVLTAPLTSSVPQQKVPSQVSVIGRVQLARGIVDLDKSVQIGRCCQVDAR